MKALKLTFLLPLLLGLQLQFVGAESSEKAQKLDECIATFHKLERFRGSVLVAKADEVLLNKGYGYANAEHAIENSPQTKHRLASVSKQFTAVSILQLMEKGLVDLHKPITAYLKDYPETGNKITIHHLLSHTSGVPNYTNFENFLRTASIPVSLDELIQRFKDKPLDFEPGEGWIYSNSGYVLLGKIIEVVSGQSYEEYVQKNIFDVVGMENSGYDKNSEIISNRASGYKVDRDDRLIHSDALDMSVVYAAGALYSTAEDLRLWDLALYSEKILSKDSIDLMFTPVESQYGYGWRASELFGHRLVGHSGGVHGFSTQIVRFIDDNAVIVILGNQEGNAVSDMTEIISAILFDKNYKLPLVRKEIKVDPEILKQYVGKFELAPNIYFTISMEGDSLYAALTGQSEHRIYAETESYFFYKFVEARISFIRPKNGQVNELVLHQNGRHLRAHRVTDE